MNRVPKRGVWDRIGVPVVFILIAFLAFLVLLIVFARMNPPEPYGPPYVVTMQFIVEYDEVTDTYVVDVNQSSSDPQGILKSKDLSACLYDQHRNRIKEYILADILDDEQSDITFYDNDRNGLLTVGDEFTIDGGIVEPNYEFLVINTRYGNLVNIVELN